MKYNFEINIVHYKELKERKQKLENELEKHNIKYSFIDNFDRKSLTKEELSKFTDDNRAGIERTLHRISCIRNRQGLIIGLTCRVGRAMYGTINIIRDLLESGKSILILGKPGVGKTTMVREIARVLANEMEKRVVIIDTSNEIAGDSDVPHIGIGRARRMQVSKTDLQHKVMIEAVENHMPEVIVIDEIGTELEARAAQTIAERGVQLIGTAHGNYLGSLIKNPTLSDLVGGIAGAADAAVMAFSDRRLKKDIKLIGLSPSGIKIYNFKYKFTKGIFQGVMSDEIPSFAVIKDNSGFDKVDYSKIDVKFKKI